MFGHVLTLCLYFILFSRVLGAWEGSREALGDAWGIIEGQLAPSEHLGQVERQNDNMRCDMMMCV